MHDKKLNIHDLYILIFFVIIGTLPRLYNINFDDLWSDEMFSYWISDPDLSFKETLVRQFSTNWMILYEILLKYFHLLFGYEIYISRYFSLTLSVFSIIIFYFLLNEITSKKSLILGLLILSVNIFHIKYSIELRSYILCFFLVTLYIYLSFKNHKKKNNFKNIILINFTGLLMLFSHAFTIIVIFSYIIFSLLKFFKKKQSNTIEVYNLAFNSASIIFFLIIYYLTTLTIVDQDSLKGISPAWLEPLKLSFYTDYFFSDFFGSRILGGIHLLVLIFCIINFRKEIFLEINVYTFLFILLIFSYLIPISYGYLFDPMMLDRYIFFVLIPIIALLSHFVFKIKGKIKYLIIFLLIVPVLINHFLYENSFRQFYSNIYPTKPEVGKALRIINESNTKNFTIKFNEKNFININNVYENYLNEYKKYKNYDLTFFNYSEHETTPKKIWFIYIKDITSEDFKVPTILKI